MTNRPERSYCTALAALLVLAFAISTPLVLTGCPNDDLLSSDDNTGTPGDNDGTDDGDGGNGGGTDPTVVAFSGLSAANGSAGTTTTQLTLSFDADPTTLTADDITVTGATKGALSGSGTTRTLEISAIAPGSVGQSEPNVTVALASPTGYEFTTNSLDATVHLNRFEISNTDNAGSDFGLSAGNNRGLGQEIQYGDSYLPESFSVSINPAISTGEISIVLAIWSDLVASPDTFGSSTTIVPGNTTGSVECSIQNATRIPAGNAVRYALYVENAVGQGLSGGDLRINNDTASYNAGSMIMSVGTDDSSVASPAEWQTTGLGDLAFTLTGVVVD